MAPLNRLADGDGDGLPDRWEAATLRTLGWNGTQDVDGDGETLRTEYLAGTHPADSMQTARAKLLTENGVLHVETISPVSEGIGYEGLRRVHRLEERERLDVGDWEVTPGCERLPATGSVIRCPIAVPMESGKHSMFYRWVTWLE